MKKRKNLDYGVLHFRAIRNLEKRSGEQRTVPDMLLPLIDSQHMEWRDTCPEND